MVDLRDAATRKALGVTVDELAGERSAAQVLAGRLRTLGAQGVVAPSAARLGHWNLVVFPDGFGHVTVRRGRSMHPAPPPDQREDRRRATSVS